ncbi:uncharacterized protein LOC119723597 isoform X1 [Patiria miniata]|uniref:Uncharacterized protein n=1 Tax=Patiria miniata TaxID=46514 RepID=A0A913ZGW2_PATMI|nr:uncharacterized protein LOC119723597 isoform X1 [Patiria miniata]XP_038050256.1 uncharacterized protein LOC119723597 isoform X2 [Patiria miniata]XP_038050257.1 uncharacterized protein LOC119723597 isoform X1 [Patiria miniata]
MPGKGKKKGKGKGKKKKKLKGMGETPGDIVKRLYRIYLNNCENKKSIVCPSLKNFMKSCYEDNKLIVKFILEPVADYQDPEISNVKLEPLVMSLRQERYKYIKELHVWDIPLKHEHLASLALMLDKGVYPLTRLELIDCDIDAYAVERLMKCMPMTIISTLAFDYNEFGDEGLRGICKGLKNNRLLLSLSLCYCDLGVEAGSMLGDIVSTTALRDIYLNGNNLEAEGAIELIKLAADHAEMETYERNEGARLKAEEEAQALLLEKERGRMPTAMSSEEPAKKPDSAKSSKAGSGKKKKKKGKKKKKTKAPPEPPPVGPWIHKLHLEDNGIDSYGRGSTYAPVIVTRLLRQLIQHSSCLQELDIDDNLIGDLGGREILEALNNRKEAGHPSMKMSVTHRMNSETFAAITKLGAGLKKKGKKKGKKKKKKK